MTDAVARQPRGLPSSDPSAAGLPAAELIYDSATAGAVRGQRSGLAPRRALGFRFGKYTVDLVVTTRRDGTHCVHGQIGDERSRRAPTRAEISMDEKQGICDSGDFGEFALLRGADERIRKLEIRTPDAEFECEVPPAED